MCITQQNVLQLLVSDLFAKMHTPVRAHRSLTTQETKPEIIKEKEINTNIYTSTHKEYGEGCKSTTTMCTQCKRVFLPSLLDNGNGKKSGISIRLSKEEDDQWVTSDEFNVLPTTCLSHGLCNSCFNDINTNLLTSAFSTLSTSSPSSSNFLSNNNNINKTTFSLSSSSSPPRSRSFLSKSVSSPQLSRHLPSRPKRILIVDDNRLQRQIHKRMVENAGYECDVAYSGAQALELVQKHNYSLILMDLVMSPMDGWTTTRKIRHSLLLSVGSSFQLPKIVAVTGLRVEEELKEKCLQAGMDEVLQKPISTEIINNVLQKYCHPTKAER